MQSSAKTECIPRDPQGSELVKGSIFPAGPNVLRRSGKKRNPETHLGCRGPGCRVDFRNLGSQRLSVTHHFINGPWGKCWLPRWRLQVEAYAFWICSKIWGRAQQMAAETVGTKSTSTSPQRRLLHECGETEPVGVRLLLDLPIAEWKESREPSLSSATKWSWDSDPFCQSPYCWGQNFSTRHSMTIPNSS